MNPREQQNHEPTLDELRQRAAETRLRLAEDVSALTYKLSPGNLKQEAKEALRERANQATLGLRTSAARAGHNSREFGEQLWFTARHHPVPTAMVGAGIGWLVYRAIESRRWRSVSQPPALRRPVVGSSWEQRAAVGEPPWEQRAAEPPWDPPWEQRAAAPEPPWEQRAAVPEPPWQEPWEQRSAVESLWEQRGRARRTASGLARRETQRMTEVYEQNPLLIGAAVLGVGLAVGWLLPHTRREDAWAARAKPRLAAAKDKLVDQAKGQARDVVEQMKHAAQEASSSAATSKPSERQPPPSGSLVSAPPT